MGERSAATQSAAPRRGRRPKLSGRVGRAVNVTGLLSLPVGWLVVFFVVPVLLVALYSVGLVQLFPGDPTFNIDSWTAFFDSIYPGLFWKSVRMAFVTSALCVVLAYPIAYFLAMVAGGRKYVLLLVILLPFLTSFLLRVLAWKVILGDQGVINSVLYSVGLRADGDPLPALIYSQFTVMLVLGYIWIPFVVLPIFVSLVGMDARLIEAARDLGASRWHAFWRVTFPMSLPGVGAAFAFVFIPTIGEFVTPSLVGGTSGFMYGNAVADLFGPGFDWPQGSVLAVFLLVAVLAIAAVFARSLRLRNLATEA